MATMVWDYGMEHGMVWDYDASWWEKSPTRSDKDVALFAGQPDLHRMMHTRVLLEAIVTQVEVTRINDDIGRNDIVRRVLPGQLHGRSALGKVHGDEVAAVFVVKETRLNEKRIGGTI